MEAKLLHTTTGRKPAFELFDHRKDPLDSVDLAIEHPKIVERLLKEFEVWKEEATAARHAPSMKLERNLSPEQIERLRALGYIR